MSKRERFFYLAICSYIIGATVAVGAFFRGQYVIGAVVIIGVVCFGVAANDMTFAVVPWRNGEDAENAVQVALEELRRDDYLIANDLWFGGEGNIDHLVSGPNGVFMIETKSARYTLRQLGRAKRQAVRIHDELGCWVAPVICAGNRKKSYVHARVVITGRAIVAETIRARPNRGRPDPERLRQFVDRHSR